MKVVGLTLLFLYQGFSLCLFYNFAFYGQVLLPLADPVGLLTPLAYYLAMSSKLSAVTQAILWLLSSVLAGWVWLAAHMLLAPAVRARVWGAALFIVPGVWLAYLHAWTPQGLSWAQFVKACLVRNFAVSPPSGLIYLYHVLGLVSLLTEWWLLARERGRLYAAGRIVEVLFISLVVVSGAAFLSGWLIRLAFSMAGG